jgi:hypothetical protein
MHKCKAVHDQSTPVIEMFGGKKVWEGVVEAFALSGHAKARRCYAWSSHDGKETQHVTVLEIPLAHRGTSHPRWKLKKELIMKAGNRTENPPLAPGKTIQIALGVCTLWNHPL